MYFPDPKAPAMTEITCICIEYTYICIYTRIKITVYIYTYIYTHIYVNMYIDIHT